MLSGTEELRQFKIFAELSEADLRAIADISDIREYAGGEKISTEGDPADRLFLFMEGRAEVKIVSTDGIEILIDELGPGEVLGWGAIMEPHVYTASAWAAEDTRAVVIDGPGIRRLCDTNQHIGFQVSKGIGEVMSRRFDLAIGGPSEPTLGEHEIEELRLFKLFSELDYPELAAIAEIAQVKQVISGERLTIEGGPADHLYLFLKGRAEVSVLSPEGHQVLIDELGPGEILGWGAVMEPHVYTASAWTTEPSEVIVLPGTDLRALSERNERIGYQVAKGIGEVISRRFGRAVGGPKEPPPEEHSIEELLRFGLFAELELADLDAVARISRIVDYEPGVELTVEDAPADNLYLFLRGQAAIKIRTSDGDDLLIDQLGPGEMLGWGAVVEPHVYTATAVTTEPTKVIVIDGEALRGLFETNRSIGYQVLKSVGEVVSKRFDQALTSHRVDELLRFEAFAELDLSELDAIESISHVQEFAFGEKLATEGAPADKLYLLLQGRIDVKVRTPEGEQILIDQLGPGEMLGWGAVTAPHVYATSAWTSEHSEIIIVDGNRLRNLCNTNEHLGYKVVKGVGEVMSRRFGRAIGSHGDLVTKDLRAFGGKERVIWASGEVQLTTEAVLIGMETDSPEVIPLEAIFDTQVAGDCVMFRAHGGDVCSPPVDDPGRLAALTQDAVRRSRYAQRRKDQYLG